MSLFPFSSVENIGVVETKPLPLYREVSWDYKENKPILENNDFKIVEGIEAIKIWCYKALLVPRFQYEVYSWNYGCEVMELIGKAYTPSLTKEECKRYIKEALEVNEYITSVEVVETSFVDSLLSANIKIETIYGSGEVNI